MIGLVLVSHSGALAKAVADFVRGLSAYRVPVAHAGGTGKEQAEPGVDTSEVARAIESVYSTEGVVVLADFGTAVQSAELAIKILGKPSVHLCTASFTEGAVAAAAEIAAGAGMGIVIQEALGAFSAKQGDAGEESSADETDLPGLQTLSFRFYMSEPDGMHARPAAELVKTVFPFKSTVKIANLSRSKVAMNAKSVNNIALSNIAHGDLAEITASGEDAQALMAAVKKLVTEGFRSAEVHEDTPERSSWRTMTVLSPGIAVGTLYMANNQVRKVLPQKIYDVDAEIERLHMAVKAAQRCIAETRDMLEAEGLHSEAAIFEAHLMMAEDADVLRSVEEGIRLEKLSAAYVYQQKIEDVADGFRRMSAGYIKERLADLQDVARQVLEALEGEISPSCSSMQDVILCAEEVTPSLLGRFQSGSLRGILTYEGGSSSHTAILARALGIPAITGYKAPKDAASGARVIIDGFESRVILNPTKEELKKLQNRKNAYEVQLAEDIKYSAGKADTLDQVSIPVYANVGDVATAIAAVKNGAEGVGLLRTEFLFMNRRSEPTEAEQVTQLRAVFAHFGRLPVTVRTLDIGGDKDIPWMSLPHETNPFLGVRGIRLCMQQEALFRRHMRAILQAGHGHNISVMIPMVSVSDEILFSKKILNESHEELVKEGREHAWPVRFGIMVETPAAVLQADAFAQLVDFFSIGTNDLSQYVMSAERGSKDLAILQHPMQPALLSAIKQTADVAKRHKIEVVVCGEMAGTPLTAKALLGLGAESLSMNAVAIAHIKQMIRSVKLHNLKEIADKVLQEQSIEAVERLFS